LKETIKRGVSSIYGKPVFRINKKDVAANDVPHFIRPAKPLERKRKTISTTKNKA
jgi:hypothetical protein